LRVSAAAWSNLHIEAMPGIGARFGVSLRQNFVTFTPDTENRQQIS